ncbi:MAG: phytanoyl-CoA dioxygenase family protein [Proteobacteria bacterium]|nr:phytanoyl-CoA dioxygenase family protein [Pseudomonadota bacterium]
MRLLSSTDMAHFAARGFLRFDGIVPADINQQFLDEVGDVPVDEIASPAEHYARVMARGSIPVIPAGQPLKQAYPEGGAVHRMLCLPEVAGAIRSLVGDNPGFDHHFLHITFPPAFYGDDMPRAQHTHQDSTIDPRSAFDIQIMYFPHEVTADMGGTRFVPGSHLRRVSEAAISRYQNIAGQQHVVCPAGTLLIMHMGIWHGGGANTSHRVRYMFKIRMYPTQRQARLWDISDLPDEHFQQRPIFWTGGARDPGDIHTILTQPEPWFEMDTSRLEYINRIRFWRYLLGDEQFDADFWLTRIENEF